MRYFTRFMMITIPKVNVAEEKLQKVLDKVQKELAALAVKKRKASK